VVAIDKTDYSEKMELILSDSNTYSIVKHNPTNKLIAELEKILKK